ncbi:hypothetical protein [Vibrio fluvialis]|uniref:hypothetical protein n=1 Tax=Vibrio fluvialis TaxID=676 RepID=UPI001EEC2BC7|nr:hypothetical protein [Vibrio fluvialis]MCG6398903.1 hypothetical protein [Vibrio fluvialis]
MAKKTPKKNSSLNPVKMFIRLVNSNSNPTNGLSIARQKIAEKNYHLIINSLKDQPEYKKIIVGTDFYKLEDYIGYRKTPIHLEKEKQFVWTSLVISMYIEEINRFLILKNEFEVNFINGSYELAEEALKSIEYCFGTSLWSINSRIELLQKSKGVEYQKAYLEEIVSVKNIDFFLAFVSYIFSLRNEENNTIESYFNEIEHALEVNGISDYLVYHFLPSHMTEIKKTETVLNFEERHSIIDRYIALINMMELEVSSCEKESINLVKKCIKPLEEINDNRINKLKFICSEEYDVNLVNGGLHKYDDYTKGNYEIDLPCNSENLDVIIRSSLFSEETLDKYSKNQSIYSEVVKTLHLALSNKSKISSSLDKLTMIALRCDKTDFSRAILRYTANLSDTNDHKNIIYHDLSLDLNNPRITDSVESVRGDKIDSYGSFLRTLYPNSPSLILNANYQNNYEYGYQSISNLVIPEYRKLIYLGNHNLNNNMFDAAEEIFKTVSFGNNLYLESKVRKNIVQSQIKNNKVIDSIENIVEHFLNNPNSISIYNVEQFIDLAIKGHKKEAFKNDSFCILMNYYARNIHPKSEGKLSDIFENILDKYDAEYPTELLNHIEKIGKEKLIYLFRYVAIPRVLDDYTIFEDLNEIDEERIKICQILIDIDSDNILIYSDEIKDLTREAKINNLVNLVNNSKVRVNEDGVLSNVEDTLSRLYKKYQKLLSDPELTFKVEKIAERLKELALDSSIDDMTLHTSDRESSLTFLCIYLLDELTLNPVYGLDTHISTSIRHGAFEGQVRRAFDEFELLQNDSGNKSLDKIPQRWRYIFEKYNESNVKNLCSAFESFSKKVNNIINTYLTVYLHINKKNSSTKGMFDFRNFPFKSIKEQISVDTSYEDFKKIYLSVFWDHVENSMINIQNSIDKEVRLYLLKSIESMQRNVIEQLTSSDSDLFSNCINEVKTNFECYIDELNDWFTKPEKTILEEFSLDLVSSVSIKQVNNCYVRSMIEVKENISKKIRFKGKYFNNFVEVLFILLQNVIRHSGLSENKATLSIDVHSNELTLTLINKIDQRIDIEQLRSDIPKLNKKYSEENALAYANKEGGSGLSKIWRIIELDICTKSEFEFSLNNNDNFVARLKFNIEELQYENMCN